MDLKQYNELYQLLASMHKQLVLIESNTSKLLKEYREAKKKEAPEKPVRRG